MARLKTRFRTRLFRRLPRPGTFLRDDKGASAVEFAMVAMPFFALLGGLIELGMIFMVQVTLDNALQDASREIRTGLAQSATTTALQQEQLANMHLAVCKNMAVMVTNCDQNLKLTVDAYPSFAAVPLQSPVKAGVFNLVQNYNTGAPGGIVVVKAYYQWALFFPVLNQAMQSTSGKSLIMSLTTFANEPFTAAAPIAVTPGGPWP
jgi:Flp pilus assembly protein TadG